MKIFQPQEDDEGFATSFTFDDSDEQQNFADFLNNMDIAFLKSKFPVIDEGKVGELVLGSARRLGPFVPGRVADIGIIKDLAIHDIDISRHLVKHEATSVYAIAGSLVHKYEDHANLVIRFDDKPTFFIECNWLTPRKTRGLNITGSEGVLSLDYISQEVSLGTSFWTQKSTAPWDEPLKRELTHFAQSVAQREQPQTSGMDGLEALRIAEAALESAQSKRIVHLEEEI